MAVEPRISLISYACTPAKVFVRIPNERGRWTLTDRCVVEVACPTCGAVMGSPASPTTPRPSAASRRTGPACAATGPAHISVAAKCINANAAKATRNAIPKVRSHG